MTIIITKAATLREGNGESVYSLVEMMINKEEAKVDALVAIADLVGLEYFREHITGACEAYPTNDLDDVEWEYFLGFDDVEDEGEDWNVFVRVSVNRETEVVTILDYRTPDGRRMDNPIKPISFA